MVTRIKTEVAKTFVLKLLSKDAIKADQDNIRVNILDLDKSVHDNAVQCLLHAKEHGDTSLMRRLLIDVLGTRTTQTGYRTQGLINWMRKHSPMELKGDVINLSGVLDGPSIASLHKQYPELVEMELVSGAKRPFLIEQANRTPFTKDADNQERVAKPVFQQTALGKVDQMVKEILGAAENTLNGQPIDASKPFYDGIHLDTVVDFAQKVKEMRDSLPKDSTLNVRKAQAEQRRLGEFIDANIDDVNEAQSA